MNFIVWCPMAYTENSGGILALHRLAHNLAVCGEKSFITTKNKRADYLGNQITEEEAVAMQDKIVIYPEVLYGNPYKSDKVVRWLLNTRGVIPFKVGDGEDGENDLVYKWSSAYKADDESKVVGYLTAIDNHLDIFYNQHKERKGDCYIVRKGKNTHVHSGDAINIEDYQNNKYLSDVFNRCERFICYDNACYLVVLAALCGCLPIVIPNGKFTKQEWYNSLPSYKYGIAYGFDEIQHAIDTKYMVRENLIYIEQESLTQTREFIKKAYSI